MKGSQSPENRYCPNCHYPLPAFGEFCSNCSQKYTDGRVTFWQLVSEFAESVLNIDSKIFLTIRALFVPGRLTKDYFKGRQKRYVSPLRLFFIMAVLHFAVLGYLGFDQIEEQVANFTERQKEKAHLATFRDQLDSARSKVEEAYPDEGIAIALDSLERAFRDPRMDSVELGYFHISQKGSIELQEVRISNRDAIEMPIDSLLESYKVSSFVGQVQIRQGLRLNRQGGNFTRFALGKMIWMVALMMPALALLLKLLYIRRQQYYVEHLVFSFHYHAFSFFIVTVVLVFNQAGFGQYTSFLNSELLFVLSLAWILIYLFLAMRRFYGQGWLKTFLKYSIVNFSYLFIFSLFLVLTLIATALLF